MDLDDMILVSVDDHIIEPPTVFERHIAKRWADRAPRFVYDPQHRAQTWVWEGGAAATPFICAVVTLPNEPEELFEHFSLAKCSDAEIAKIGHETALRWLRFDPFRHVPRAKATVGALRARAVDVDLSTRSKAEYRREWEAAHGPIA
jgi:hypothetical protein